jgi:hypothetical protein
VSVQVKLGRWRTRDGIAEVREFDTVENKWVGTIEGNRKAWWGEKTGYCYSMGSDYDLREYLGPLDAPTDLAAFIAGLKPGDVYRANDAGKWYVIAKSDGFMWVQSATGGIPVTVSSNVAFFAYPAWPWVEPPKVETSRLPGTFVVGEGGEPYLLSKGANPSRVRFAQRFTLVHDADGLRLELGEIVKQ